jgi:hypothetical protein
MASLADLTTAIAAAATKEVAKALKVILSKVAEDYELDYDELEAKYLSKESLKAKPKGKAPVKAKVTKKVESSEDEGGVSCIAVTKKGERCKCKPRSGETTCGRHKDFDPEAPEQPKPAAKPRGRPRKAKSDSDSDEEEMAAPKRAKRGAGSKPAPTRHEHLLEESKSDCEECESHGGPFHLKEDKEEFEVVDEAAMMARIKDLTEEDEEAELEEGEVAEGSDDEPSVKDDGEESGFDEE